MKLLHLLLLTVLCFNLCEARTFVNKSSEINSKIETEKKISGKNETLEILAEGAYSKVEKPFIFAVRSKETYAALQNFVENLPAASEIDFAKTAVVAAFAGTKNTGGFSVEITQSGETVSISLNKPAKDAFVTQVITMPYKIALISIEKENSLQLQMSAEWKKAAGFYKVKSGEFESSGGFAGRGAKFNAQGTINVLIYGDFATLAFNLSGKKQEKSRRLFETATGTLKNGQIQIGRLDAGTFSAGPKPPLRVLGIQTKNKISLTFESLPPTASESFQLAGKIEAVKSK